MWLAPYRAADACSRPEGSPPASRAAEGWLYGAVVIDLFSRRVVGWSMSDSMTALLVTDALMMEIWRRGMPDALLHHSDRAANIRARSPSG